MNDNSKLIKSNRKGKDEQCRNAMEVIVRSSEEEDQEVEELGQSQRDAQ